MKIIPKALLLQFLEVYILRNNIYPYLSDILHINDLINGSLNEKI